MARLASQSRGGYYAIPPEALQLAIDRLTPPSEGLHLFDCCAGEGLALAQLAHALGCAPDNTWAVELEEERAQAVRANIPGVNAIAPASFFGTRIRSECFSLAYANPPFDDAIGGGGRLETDFLSRVLKHIAPKGVLCFVAPERVVLSYPVQNVLLTWCDHLSCVPFPEHVRNFSEVIVLGVKRRTLADPRKRNWRVDCFREHLFDYTLPPATGPRGMWEKTELTENELLAALDASPLRKRLEPPPDRPLPSPPLSLGAGHIALLLASGHLDGLVCPPGEPPHVVRGSAVKIQESTDVQVEETEKSVTTRETITERIKLCVRVADAAGNIVTLT